MPFENSFTERNSKVSNVGFKYYPPEQSSFLRYSSQSIVSPDSRLQLRTTSQYNNMNHGSYKINSPLYGQRLPSDKATYFNDSCNRSRINNLKLEYGDIDDVFCPSYVERDFSKVRSSANTKNGKVTTSENIPETKPCVSDASEHQMYSENVDADAERALLLSMGWNEANDEECQNDLSEEEILEFYRMIDSLQKSRINKFGMEKVLKYSKVLSNIPGSDNNDVFASNATSVEK